MFEKIGKIEQAEQKDLVGEFREKEKDIIQSGIKTFEKASPRDIRKKASFRAKAAFLTFLTGSAMADRAFAQESTEKVSPETVAEETLQYDWEKLVNKIEISYAQEGKSFEEKDFSSKRLSQGEYSISGVDTILTKIMDSSSNSSEFFKMLQETEINESQKLALLQKLGHDLNKTYNYDMLEENKYMLVSDEKMFESLKLYFETGEIDPGGICGNIHTFLVKVAQNLGMEAWLQNGLVDNEDLPSHVWAGLVAKGADGKEQIVFLDYETLIPTGTTNYRDALGIAERYHQQISAFNSYVGTTKKILFPVKSLAQEKIEEAAGVKGSGKILSERLEHGKIVREQGLNIKLSNETQEIKFSKDFLALAAIHYQDSGNPYQSLESLNALRASLRLGKEKFGLEFDTTFLNLNIKDLGEGVLAQREIINRLNLDFINSHQFNKKDYEKFVLSYGASLEVASRLILGKFVEPSEFADSFLEGAVGLRLTYFDPNNLGKFFVETTDSLRLQLNDFQNQELILKQAAIKLKIGAALKVREGTLLNLESAVSKLDSGKKYEASIGAETKKIKGKIGFQKMFSEYETFIPSSGKISAEFGYKIGDKPKGEIIIFGSKSKEENELGVKIRIFLW